MKAVLLTLVIVLSASASQSAGAPEEKIKVRVTEEGFEPSEIKVKAGSHLILAVTRTTDSTCATAIHVKEKKIKKDLPLNKEVNIDLGIVPKGEVKFACGMDMISAHVIAE